MQIEYAERLRKLPPYVFREISRLNDEAIKRGDDIINLGIGDPDQPTPRIIVEALHEASLDARNHQYPIGSGLAEFRAAVMGYYERTRGIKLDPDKEVLALIGSKEGLAHFPLAFVNPGDVVLVPEPGYPVYNSSAIFAGGVPFAMPLLSENGFLPDLEAIPSDVYDRTKLMFLNYPNNPTAAFATVEFFEQVIQKAKKYGFIVLHDAAYLDMVYGGEKALSFLEVPGARDVGLELHSLSKTFNMTGWRLAFAVGNAKLISGLANLKANVDSGAFNAIQRAGIVALNNFESLIPGILDVYERRLVAFNEGVKELGWLDCPSPKGTFYVWLRTRGGRSSMEMTSDLIRECAIVTTPGSGFGAAGEGFFRLALTTSEDRIREACKRMKKAGFV